MPEDYQSVIETLQRKILHSSDRREIINRTHGTGDHQIELLVIKLSIHAPSCIVDVIMHY